MLPIVKRQFTCYPKKIETDLDVKAIWAAWLKKLLNLQLRAGDHPMHHHHDDNFSERKIYFADFHVNIHFSSLRVSSYPCAAFDGSKQSCGYVLSAISEFSYKLIRFLLHSSIVKSDNEIGKFSY